MVKNEVLKTSTENKKLPVGQIIFYVGMGIVLLWILLKSAGIIKTPFWLEYGIPLAGFVIGVLGWNHALFTYYHKLLENDYKMAVSLATLTTQFGYLTQQVERMENKKRSNC